jgi:DNA-binding transcriptional regulator YiaG
MRKEVTRESAIAKFEERLRKKEKVNPRIETVRFYEPMTAEEFSDARKSLDVSQSKLGQILDLSTRAIQSYEQGINPVPGVVAKILRLMKTNPNVFQAMIMNTPDSKEKKALQSFAFVSVSDMNTFGERFNMMEKRQEDQENSIMLINASFNSFVMSKERKEI